MAALLGESRPDTVKKVLAGVYVDEAAVDEELVDIILAPAFTDNALEVFVSVITGLQQHSRQCAQYILPCNVSVTAHIVK